MDLDKVFKAFNARDKREFLDIVKLRVNRGMKVFEDCLEVFGPEVCYLAFRVFGLIVMGLADMYKARVDLECGGCTDELDRFARDRASVALRYFENLMKRIAMEKHR